jgi:hypothetical protein
MRDSDMRDIVPKRQFQGGGRGYALAKTTGLPLLFKGDDFAQTDIESALASTGGPS